MNGNVSVIIPCYNAASMVGRAIESVLRQTRPADEILVVDDGSSDGSQDIVRTYEPRVRLIQAAHGGAGAARNRGLAEATGDWVKFLDNDDELEPSVLERQLRAAGEESGSKTIVFGDYVKFYADGRPEVAVSLGEFTQMEQVEFLVCSNIQTSLSLYPREALTTVGGFPTELERFDETLMNLRLCLAGWSFAYRPGCASRIFIHSSPHRINVKFSSRRVADGELRFVTLAHEALSRSSLPAALCLRAKERLQRYLVAAAAEQFWRGRIPTCWSLLQEAGAVAPVCSRRAFEWPRILLTRGYAVLREA